MLSGVQRFISVAQSVAAWDPDRFGIEKGRIDDANEFDYKPILSAQPGDTTLVHVTGRFARCLVLSVIHKSKLQIAELHLLRDDGVFGMIGLLEHEFIFIRR